MMNVLSDPNPIRSVPTAIGTTQSMDHEFLHTRDPLAVHDATEFGFETGSDFVVLISWMHLL